MRRSQDGSGGRRAVSSGRAAAALAILAVLSGCNPGTPPTASDETKRSLDQLVQVSREGSAADKETATATKGLLDEVRKLSGRIEALEKAVTAAESSRKRGAIALPIDTETTCDNDSTCANTARAVCNRVGYPKAIASRYTPATRPTLQAVVCFD